MNRASDAPALKQAFTVVFLRDWHPVLRDPLDLFRLSFPIGALIFAVQGDWDAAVRLFLPGLAVFAVRAIDVPRAVDWVFCAAMFFQGWGNALHLFNRFWWYDNSVHITQPMSLAPIYEWVVDHWFGQHLFIGETDTVTDLADGFLGAGIGGLFLAGWALTHYTSRRLPRPLRLHRSRRMHGVGQQP